MVVLEKYPPPPVLDVAINVAEELVKEGKAEIDVAAANPYREILVGIAVDTERLLWKLYPWMDVYVNIKNESMFYFPSEREDVKRYTLQINIDERKRISRTESEDLVETTILSCDPFSPTKLSIQARKLEKVGRQNPIERTLRKYLQEDYRGETLCISYGNPSPFAVEMPHQSFSPLRTISPYVELYPVSSRCIHQLDTETWRFFREPVYWDRYGQWIAQTLNVLAGEYKEEDIAKKYDKSIEKVRSSIQRAKDVCFKLMDMDYKKDDICTWLNVPPPYRSYFLYKPLKTLSYFANPTTVDNLSVRNLVDAYNKEYAVHGKSEINPEILCKDRYNALKQN